MASHAEAKSPDGVCNVESPIQGSILYYPKIGTDMLLMDPLG